MGRRGRVLIVAWVSLALAALVGAAPASAAPPTIEGTPDADVGGPSVDAPAGTAIVGGHTAAPGTWPEVAALLGPSGSPAEAQFCAGTLVDPSWVVTAAHCVVGHSYPATQIRVLLGSQDLGGGGEVRAIDRVVVHPGYPQASGAMVFGSGHDVALLHLRTPSSQPTMPFFEHPLGEGHWGRATAAGSCPGTGCGLAAGWGLTGQHPNTFPDELQEAQLALYADDECEQATNGVFLTGGEICGGYADVNVCRGDSGGPLLADDGTGRLRLAGIVSWGYSECTPRVSMFTRVDAFGEWIRSVLDEPVALSVAGSGYWMVSTGGTVYAFGGVGDGSDADARAPVTALEGTPSGLGYWVLDESGTVWAMGDAPYLGSAPDGPRWTSLAATPTGRGYWAFSDRGTVATFGDAAAFGDLGDVRLNGPILDAVATPSGLGYYMVASDGGVFAFGDAAFHGSMGGTALNRPVRSLVPDPDGVGYWLVASDGGVFAFEAEFRGSMGGVSLAQPVVGMVDYGDGYLMVAADGGIFNFSTQAFAGSLGGTAIPEPIVAVAAH